MTLKINDQMPDFTANTNRGPVRFHDWAAGSWVLLFSHPKDFTPVCTTEMGALAALEPEFTARGCKLIGLSIDSAADHDRWLDEVERSQGHPVRFPLIADEDLAIAKQLGMLPAAAAGTAAGRSAADNATVRTVFIIGPDLQVKLTLAYPMTTGRFFPELLRALDSLQLTHRHKVATPADWTPGKRVVIAPSVSDAEARATYPDGWEAQTPYLRLVSQQAVER